MSMLADRKPKQKWSLNPRGKQWSEDSTKFGQRMLERMGWKHGKGLGANEDGLTEHLKVTYKNDQKGMGYKEKEEWTQHHTNFGQLLKDLNGDSIENDKVKINSLHEKAETVRTRINYHKFTKGKDLSRYSERDLANIFGRKTLKPKPKEKEIEKVEPEDPSSLNLINKGSIAEYFRKKLESLTRNSEASSGKTGKDEVETIESEPGLNLKAKVKKLCHLRVQEIEVKEQQGDNFEITRKETKSEEEQDQGIKINLKSNDSELEYKSKIDEKEMKDGKMEKSSKIYNFKPFSTSNNKSILEFKNKIKERIKESIRDDKGETKKIQNQKEEESSNFEPYISKIKKEKVGIDFESEEAKNVKVKSKKRTNDFMGINLEDNLEKSTDLEGKNNSKIKRKGSNKLEINLEGVESNDLNPGSKKEIKKSKEITEHDFQSESKDFKSISKWKPKGETTQHDPEDFQKIEYSKIKQRSSNKFEKDMNLEGVESNDFNPSSNKKIRKPKEITEHCFDHLEGIKRKSSNKFKIEVNLEEREKSNDFNPDSKKKITKSKEDGKGVEHEKITMKSSNKFEKEMYLDEVESNDFSPDSNKNIRKSKEIIEHDCDHLEGAKKRRSNKFKKEMDLEEVESNDFNPDSNNKFRKSKETTQRDSDNLEDTENGKIKNKKVEKKFQSESKDLKPVSKRKSKEETQHDSEDFQKVKHSKIKKKISNKFEKEMDLEEEVESNDFNPDSNNKIRKSKEITEHDSDNLQDTENGKIKNKEVGKKFLSESKDFKPVLKRNSKEETIQHDFEDFQKVEHSKIKKKISNKFEKEMDLEEEMKSNDFNTDSNKKIRKSKEVTDHEFDHLEVVKKRRSNKFEKEMDLEEVESNDFNPDSNNKFRKSKETTQHDSDNLEDSENGKIKSKEVEKKFQSQSKDLTPVLKRKSKEETTEHDSKDFQKVLKIKRKSLNKFEEEVESNGFNADSNKKTRKSKEITEHNFDHLEGIESGKIKNKEVEKKFQSEPKDLRKSKEETTQHYSEDFQKVECSKVKKKNLNKFEIETNLEEEVESMQHDLKGIDNGRIERKTSSKFTREMDLEERILKIKKSKETTQHDSDNMEGIENATIKKKNVSNLEKELRPDLKCLSKRKLKDQTTQHDFDNLKGSEDGKITRKNSDFQPESNNSNPYSKKKMKRSNEIIRDDSEQKKSKRVKLNNLDVEKDSENFEEAQKRAKPIKMEKSTEMSDLKENPIEVHKEDEYRKHKKKKADINLQISTLKKYTKKLVEGNQRKDGIVNMGFDPKIEEEMEENSRKRTRSSLEEIPFEVKPKKKKVKKEEEGGITNPCLDISDNDLILNVATTPILKSERSVSRTRKNVRFSSCNQEKVIPKFQENVGFVNNACNVQSVDDFSFFEVKSDRSYFDKGVHNLGFNERRQKLQEKVDTMSRTFQNCEAEIENNINEFRRTKLPRYNEDDMWIGEDGFPVDRHTTVPEGIRLSFRNVRFGGTPRWMAQAETQAKKSYKHLIKGDIIVAFKNTNLHEINGYAVEKETTC